LIGHLEVLLAVAYVFMTNPAPAASPRLAVSVPEKMQSIGRSMACAYECISGDRGNEPSDRLARIHHRITCPRL